MGILITTTAHGEKAIDVLSFISLRITSGMSWLEKIKVGKSLNQWIL